MKITKPKHLKERKGIRGGYTTTVQDILPYLPDEDCFFDCRHFVYAPASDVLPFSLTTRSNANNQQYLKLMKNAIMIGVFKSATYTLIARIWQIVLVEGFTR